MESEHPPTVTELARAGTTMSSTPSPALVAVKLPATAKLRKVVNQDIAVLVGRW